MNIILKLLHPLQSEMSTIALIVAMSESAVIGKNNQLPWNVPAELKYFRSMTRNKAIVMGSKTFASIGKPLPDRYNIVLSRKKKFEIPGLAGVQVVASPTEAIDCAERYIKGTNANADSEIMVLGGAQIYALFMPYATRLYLSIIPGVYRGDTFFPAIDWKQWDLKSEQAMDGFKAQIFYRNTA